MEIKKLLNAPEVAQLLGISRSKAYGLMQRKELPVIQIDRCVRVRLEDLEDYILAHRVIDVNE